MLPQRYRLRKSVDFSEVMRHGRKVRRGTVVLYAHSAERNRCGLVVGKQVGGAVTRNRVKRRLRHGVSDLVRQQPAMSVVIRALPGAGEAGESLVTDMRQAWAAAMGLVAR